MPTSDDQLQKKQNQVEDLRKQLRLKNEEVARLLREKENDSTASRLDEEAEKLKAEIASVDGKITSLGGDPAEVKLPVMRDSGTSGGTSSAPKSQPTEKSGQATEKKEG